MQPSEGRTKAGTSSFRRLTSIFNLAGLFLALVIAFIFFSTKIPSFRSVPNLELLARQTTIIALGALGMTLIIVSGGIDLSAGSMVALITVVVATMLKDGYSPWLALFAGILAGTAAGLFNGTLITKLKLAPFIVTLGSLSLLRGLAEGFAHEQKVDAPRTWLGDLLMVLGKDEKWKIFPIGVWIMFLFAIAVWVLLKYTVFGRHIVAIGSNETAARMSGVHVNRVKLFVYVLGGFFTGVAGVMQYARLHVGDPSVARGLELDIIAAVVIGGASLSGGQGSVAGTLLGAFFMSTIAAGFSQMGLPNWVQEIVTGAIIVLAVTLDKLRAKAT